MKTALWVVLLVVVTARVFGLAFVVSSSAGGKNSTPKSAAQAKLTFADSATRFPAPDPAKPGEEPPPAVCELGHSEAHDFWFMNENAQALPVGVFSKTCQCTTVELWIAPKDWSDVPESAKRDEAAKQLEASVKPTQLLEKESGSVVPAGGVGFVRLTWKGDHAGPKALSAKLWMDEVGPGPTQVFDVSTVFVGPILAQPENEVGDFTLEQLPQTVYVTCLSSTRTEFPLTVTQLDNRWKDESNPFEVGKPAPMTEAELVHWRNKLHGASVSAGYNVPITLRRRSKDGKTALDLGRFRQHLILETSGAESAQANKVEVTVAGSIHGDLTPVDADSIPVRLAPFCGGDKDVDQLIQLESESDVTKLELDRERTAEFLTVAPDSLTSSQTIGGRKVWDLHVQWVPNAGSGKFPRDVEGYLDSAVYVRPVYADAHGPTPACLRIPVVGSADTH